MATTTGGTTISPPMKRELLATLLWARFSLTRGSNEALQRWNRTRAPAKRTRRQFFVKSISFCRSRVWSRLAARAHIIDFVRSDLVERDQSRDTQHGGGKEYGVVRKIGAERAHERGGHGFPGPGEAVISSDARRHAVAAGDTEADRGDRWADET